MTKIKILDSKIKLRELSTRERMAGENVMRNCLTVKQGEKVLVVTDSGKIKLEAPIFFETAKSFSKDVTLIEIPPTGQSGKEPPKEVIKAMCKADVVLLVTSFSLTHTQARKKANEAGARIASLPGITLETILRTLTLNYSQIAQQTKAITALLTAASNAHLTSPNGTSILIPLEGRDAVADTGLITNPGDVGNLPAGEAYIAPLEGKANGIVIFDGAYGDMFLDEPVGITVKDGRVKKIEGGHAAAQLLRLLEAIGPSSRNIAELGVGTNKAAKLGTGILETEKVYGTVHLALGSNITIGGEVDVPYHQDGVILKPTLELDGKIILEEGQFLNLKS
jgi:leucyl aminopeptidase (aminopeptidase T)